MNVWTLRALGAGAGCSVVRVGALRALGASESSVPRFRIANLEAEKRDPSTVPALCPFLRPALRDKLARLPRRTQPRGARPCMLARATVKPLIEPMVEERPSSAAIGMVVDSNMWPQAAVLVQQLMNHGTTLPVVVFNCTELPTPAVQLINALGARVRSLTPAMPVPSEFGSERLALPFQRRDGTRVQIRHSTWSRLAVWGQTEWSRIVLLDVDVVLRANIDEMASFPADTFAPEACNPIPGMCADPPTATTGGFNSGIMVVGPSAARFGAMANFAKERIAARLRDANTTEDARQVERSHLWYPEQSFLKRYWPEVEHASVESSSGVRRGYDWTWRSMENRPPRQGTPGVSHFMSRVYNARPFDCNMCSKAYNAKVKIVHHTCSSKPWSTNSSKLQACASGGACRGKLTPCEANGMLLWHDAKTAMCARARALDPVQMGGLAAKGPLWRVPP